MATPPEIPASLIICSRNRPQLLRETVESVLAGGALPAELVIVDQSEQPDPHLSAWQPAAPTVLRYIHHRSVGLSRSRNVGIAAASHPILACLDDDMFVAPDWWAALIGALVRAGPQTVVTGRVLPAPDQGAGGFVPALVLGEAPARYAGRIGTDVLAGGHMAAFREALERVGGFDERLGAGARFPAADDNDLGFRLLEARYTIQYVPEAVIFHRAWRPQREYFTLRWRYGRGKGGFYAKYLDLRDRYMVGRMVRDVGKRLLRFPRRALWQRRDACGDLLYVGGVLSGAMQWLASETKTQR